MSKSDKALDDLRALYERKQQDTQATLAELRRLYRPNDAAGTGAFHRDRVADVIEARASQTLGGLDHFTPRELVDLVLDNV